MTPSSGTRYDSFKQYDLGKVADSVGKWTEWVWKIKWGYDSSGSLSLYKNGQEVLDLPNQGNAFNDQRGPYFKFGTYKWDWQSSADTGAASRTKYFDDLRIAAGPGASYDSVAPAQQSAAKSGIAASMAFAAPEASDKADAFAAAGETVTKNISYALGSGEDSLILTGTGAVTGTGNAHANMLSGNSAANILGGNAGDDRLSGNGGDDRLYGGGGKDHLNGGAGDDLLMGNDGKDVLVGASGADRFVFALASQTGTGETSRDEIVDFSHAQGDKIDLSSIDADSKALGNQSFAFIGSEGFSGAAGQLHATSYGGGLMVAGDLDGDKSADFQIELQGVSSLSAADFLL
jgi:Ca2+-binding RTX toxin-like protein